MSSSAAGASPGRGSARRAAGNEVSLLLQGSLSWGTQRKGWSLAGGRACVTTGIVPLGQTGALLVAELPPGREDPAPLHLGNKHGDLTPLITAGTDPTVTD